MQSLSIVAFALICGSAVLSYSSTDFLCGDVIHKNNYHELVSTLEAGYSSFCKAEIDQCILDLADGSDLSDIKIDVIGHGGQSTYDLKDYCAVCDDEHFDPKKQTIVVIIGFVSDGSYQIKDKFAELQRCSREYNLVLIDVGNSVQQLFKTVKRNVEVLGYAVAKLVSHLWLRHNHLIDNLRLVGFSYGCQVAAHASYLLHEATEKNHRISQMVFLDPAPNCGRKNYLDDACANKVIVIHSNNGYYGSSKKLGDVDIYPNGDTKLQASCKNHACSHCFAIWIYLEALCRPGSIQGLSCDSWSSFVKCNCEKNDVLTLGFTVPAECTGKYYFVTDNDWPYGLGEKGLKTKSKKIKL